MLVFLPFVENPDLSMSAARATCATLQPNLYVMDGILELNDYWSTSPHNWGYLVSTYPERGADQTSLEG